MNYFQILLAGFLGGVVRGLVGFIKHQYSYKNVPFDIKYFFLTSFLSGIIGVSVAGAISTAGFTNEFSFTPPIGFIVGYAGGDFVENIYKILIKKTDLFPGLSQDKKSK
jgi:hypothetical protein